MKRIKTYILIAMLGITSSCNYLDMIPDNISTVEHAFALRNEAEKYLFTCYSYLPDLGVHESNPGFLSGDEIWFFYPYITAYYAQPSDVWEVARGNQNITDPYLNYWDGAKGGKSMFRAIRDCNIFLENIHLVPDMDEMEKDRWIGEVKFLKAYYHWFLLRMYGPVPITDVNLPISVTPEEAQVFRDPVDDVFNYVVNLLDESILTLPTTIVDQVNEMGRITKPIALALKARVLVTAASPLFNGNPDYANFVDKRGVHLFNSVYMPEKWEKAAQACIDAIEMIHSNGNQLHYFSPAVNTYNLGPELKTQMDIRAAITEKWNSEIIWGFNNSMVNWIQRYAQPFVDPASVMTNGSSRPKGQWAPSLKVAEMFYTKNGLPIDEDLSWHYTDRYQLQEAGEEDKYHIKPYYTTAKLNFDREPRFYADLGFDGGIWWGNGNYDRETPWHLEAKSGQLAGKRRADEHSITGYYTKKLIDYRSVLQTSGVYSVQQYPFPEIRLSDLYLYCAEALNEVNGPTAEAYHWINLVRRRAGIPDVEESWSLPEVRTQGKHLTKEGFRDIIRHERLIEMAFEGTRYWDLLRWKRAETVLSQQIIGWDINQSETVPYYQTVLLFSQSFKKKSYLWPLKESSLIINKNLVQNPGW